MRLYVVIIKVLLILLLGATLFIWLIAHASGHKIPAETEWAYGTFSFVLVLIISLLGKRRKR